MDLPSSFIERITVVRKLVLVAALAAAVTGLSCSRDTSNDSPAPAAALATSPPNTRQAWIYFTKNYHKGTGNGQFSTDCIGTVSAEQIGARGGYKIIWHVTRGNGGSNDDICENLDVSTVSLRFATDIMGKPAMRRLPANAAGIIQGTVSSEEGDIGPIVDHKYVVYIGDTPAGPDPIIVLN